MTVAYSNLIMEPHRHIAHSRKETHRNMPDGSQLYVKPMFL